MAVFLFLVLVSAGLFLDTTKAQEDLSKLPDNYRKGVERTVKEVNSHQTIKSVFLFFKSLDKSTIDGGFGVSYLYHRFYLKATRCPKGDANPTKCAFRNDRPLIDCGICYKIYNGVIQSDPAPYINCLYKPQLTQCYESIEEKLKSGTFDDFKETVLCNIAMSFPGNQMDHPTARFSEQTC